MERGSTRLVASTAFPVGFLRGAVAVSVLILAYAALGQRTADMALPRGGCLATIAAAVCEWRILYWRIEVERAAGGLDELEFADRQALQDHRTQLARTAPWVHVLFLVGALAWGFGDLLWS